MVATLARWDQGRMAAVDSRCCFDGALESRFPLHRCQLACMSVSLCVCVCVYGQSERARDRFHATFMRDCEASHFLALEVVAGDTRWELHAPQPECGTLQ
ncbi:uncharacterized protein Tco025E_07619 [Trypanosoma conorhini]|uniref:Uncharacterized protein n=1 Tax=Trypanosoma conorhini TaxID=83891 RepID=A0A3R7KE94_9TRYP|nr:uncharacterized protein Tco025E_07619 [Trypanosoma conorhini]RNF06246.1 hypothetical protein Tco025E_07619 [Trypanosoma conorhini]